MKASVHPSKGARTQHMYIGPRAGRVDGYLLILFCVAVFGQM